jgi:hypothetical protein
VNQKNKTKMKTTKTSKKIMLLLFSSLLVCSMFAHNDKYCKVGSITDSGAAAAKCNDGTQDSTGVTACSGKAPVPCKYTYIPYNCEDLVGSNCAEEKCKNDIQTVYKVCRKVVDSTSNWVCSCEDKI